MNNKSKKIFCEISAGDLLDKISILEIKLSKITNKNNHKKINKEYKILKGIAKSSFKKNPKINSLFTKIKKINLILWNVEDKIRVCEKNKNFDKKFIALARKVYFTNDMRARIKSKINSATNSSIVEIKKYINYL